MCYGTKKNIALLGYSIMKQFNTLKELSRDRFLTPNECARLCSGPNKASLLGLRDYAILKIFLNCGLRKQEIIDLKVKDFHQEGNNFWLIVHSKGGTIDEQDIMNDRTIGAIQKYLRKSGHAEDPEAPLFQPIKGKAKTESKKLNRRSVDFMLAKYVKKAGILKKVSPHTLRHTFGTEFQALTGDIKATQRAMRHRALTSTMIYLHTDRDRVKRGLAQMNL